MNPTRKPAGPGCHLMPRILALALPPSPFAVRRSFPLGTTYLMIITAIAPLCIAIGCATKTMEALYTKEGAVTDYIEFVSTCSFVPNDRGISVSGRYEINPGGVTLTLADGLAVRARIRGDTLIDTEGDHWIRRHGARTIFEYTQLVQQQFKRQAPQIETHRDGRCTLHLNQTQGAAVQSYAKASHTFPNLLRTWNQLVMNSDSLTALASTITLKPFNVADSSAVTRGREEYGDAFSGFPYACWDDFNHDNQLDFALAFEEAIPRSSYRSVYGESSSSDDPVVVGYTIVVFEGSPDGRWVPATAVEYDGDLDILAYDRREGLVEFGLLDYGLGSLA